MKEREKMRRVQMWKRKRPDHKIDQGKGGKKKGRKEIAMHLECGDGIERCN